jgi:hypothetical protein
MQRTRSNGSITISLRRFSSLGHVEKIQSSEKPLFCRSEMRTRGLLDVTCVRTAAKYPANNMENTVNMEYMDMR